MKTVKVTTDNCVSVIEVNFHDLHSIQQAVGGYFETVHTKQMFQYFRRPMLMLVDEDGHSKGLEINRPGSFFYGMPEHGWPILGDFILAVPDGEDFLGLDDAEEVKGKLLEDFPFLQEDRDETQIYM